MAKTRIALLSAAVVTLAAFSNNLASGDEPTAASAAASTWVASDEENPLAEIAVAQPAMPAYGVWIKRIPESAAVGPLAPPRGADYSVGGPGIGTLPPRPLITVPFAFADPSGFYAVPRIALVAPATAIAPAMVNPSAAARSMPYPWRADPPYLVCTIRFIDDPNGHLKSFETLSQGGYIVGDAVSLIGAVNALANSGLITANEESSGTGPAGRHSGEVISERFDDQQQSTNRTRQSFTVLDVAGKHRLNLRTWKEANGQSHEFHLFADVGDGQAVLAKTGWLDEHSKYLLVTLAHASPMSAAEMPMIGPLPVPPAAVTASWNAAVPTTVQNPQSVAAVYANPTLPAVARSEGSQTEGSTAVVSDESEFGVEFGVPTPNFPRAFRNIRDLMASSAGAKVAQVKYEVSVVEDTSGSLAEFISSNADAPVQLLDARSIGATLRILQKHNLVQTISEPKLMANAGKPATLFVGREDPEPPLGQPFHGLKLEILGRELGGGLAVEFKLQGQEDGRKLDAGWEMIVPDGESVLMKCAWRPASGSNARAEANAATSSTNQDSVYVLVTPELLR